MYSLFSAVSLLTQVDSPNFVLFFTQLTRKLIPKTRKEVRVPGNSQNGEYSVFLHMLYSLTVSVK